MKFIHPVVRLLGALFRPIRSNAAFFVFMYVLGLVCVYATVPARRGSHAWEGAPYDLFVDVAVLCLLVFALPRRVGLWFKRLMYVFAYAVCIVDVYCFVKFGSTITPTMLLLVGETDGREAAEFLSSYVSADIVFSRVGRVLLVSAAHMAWAVVWHNRRRCLRSLKRLKLFSPSHLTISPSHHITLSSRHLTHLPFYPFTSLLLNAFGGLAFAAMFVYSLTQCLDNKRAFVRLMSYDNIGDVEHELTLKDKAILNHPVYRLAFSIYANRLTALQVDRLVKNLDKVVVDSCSFRSKNIVLIIGESYNRHHASLYGYGKDTTPRQNRRARRGEMAVFGDVVSPWNLTSFVFKHLFSLYTVGDKGEWCDYPLFPELFRKAGYHVAFLTNQFLPQPKEAVYDFSGGFFLNHPELDRSMFDTRNTRLFRYDAGLISEYDRLAAENKEHNLIILHLKGQHVDYRTRYPKERARFTADDYDRPGFKEKERRIMADYDNAVLYNDSIVDAVIKRFERDAAVIIYVPDHGEECYEGDVHFYGRMHSTEITARLAREEFDIPFWIWSSRKYRRSNPEVWSAIKSARNRRYMTDALPHLLLYLGGISTPYYRDGLNLISPHYDEARPRILKNAADYDGLKMKNEE